MEDVSISKFRAQVVRSGSTPASPGFVVSEGQNPVDPSGSGQNHLPVTIATASTGLSITESQVLGGAGTVGQYIRGDGSLADFPATTGGGSSVSYYLNGSVSQGTIGGVAYREVNRTPIFGAGTDITTSSNGYIANFITDAGDPNKLLIPAGNWNLETYFSANNGGGSPTFYVELYKYNGTTFTLIATSSGTPELIAFGTNINPYFTTLAVPETVLALTDRLALRYYVNTSGRTITLHTENGHLCQVITTFTTGLTALNGLTNQVQFFAVGTSGTDFAISSATDTHTFNLPTASATNRGALSSADWTTFNNKTSNLGTVTSVGLSSATSGVTIGSSPVTTSGTITLAIATASGSQNGLLSSTDWTTFNGKQNALTNPVTGTGTTNYLPKFTGSTTIGNSLIQESSSNIGIGVGPSFPLDLLTNSVGTFNTIVQFYNNNFTSSNRSFLRVRQQINAGASSSSYFGTGQDGNLYIIANDSARGGDLVINGNSGNVLIGTSGSDNGAKFQVSGTANFSGSIQAATDSNIVGTSVNARMLVTASGVANTVVGFNNSGSTVTGVTNNTAYLGVLQSYPLVFTTNSVERLRIEATGESTFTSTVQTSTFFRSNTPRTNSVTIGVSANANYNFIGNDNFWGIRTGTAGDFNIDVNNSSSPINSFKIAQTGVATFSGPNQSQNAVFNSTGNVLITSNASPAVNNGGSLSFGGRYWTESNTIATFGRIHGKKENSIDGGTAGYLSFETTEDATAFLSEKLRITSIGRVGIRNTSPQGLLEVGVVDTNNQYGGHFFSTFLVTEGVWTTVFNAPSNLQWNAITEFTWVSSGDFNRSGAAYMRWAYEIISANLGVVYTLFNNSQNATGSFRRNGNQIQILITGGSGVSYYVQVRIQGSKAA